MKKLFLLPFCLIVLIAKAQVNVSEKPQAGLDVSLTEATVYVDKADGLTIGKAAQLFCDDVERVTGRKPSMASNIKKCSGQVVVIGTVEHCAVIRDLQKRGQIDVGGLKGQWEQWLITTVEKPYKSIDRMLVVAGSDRRGAAYGALSISEAMGVSPFYWWADVPVRRMQQAYVSAQNVQSETPSVKYRGFFINDEDWGLKPWAATNYERSLGDIGPKTYAQVCELILRLKGNMLAPAMHSCTGAFYSHKESMLVADTFGIIITTSHCEPLLLNNAAKSEWDQERDGDWNYATNAEAIRQKWDVRLTEASRFENIYTMAMRGLHDAGLRGNLTMPERVKLLGQVIQDQRQMLSRHTGKRTTEIPQIFVPYKETMDVYEAGLEVPEDVTLVWVDDNYGYMKRVASPDEQRRSGGSGVYYHLSYLGAPHDYLWLNTTPPVLMYEELKKAYDTGVDRYWLLNVGDIKPMELGIKTFFDMAWNLNNFTIENVNRHQAHFMASVYGAAYESQFQQMLDLYYRLAWSRKPEFMGWEREWDDKAHTGLQDTEFSFQHYGEAQQRLADYRRLGTLTKSLMNQLPVAQRPSFFEMVGYPMLAAEQMNRKFLMAQLNHGYSNRLMPQEANWVARQSQEAFDSIAVLTKLYNEQLDGKWQGMMKLAPGWCALYQQLPALNLHDYEGELEPQLNQYSQPERVMAVPLSQFKPKNANGHQLRLVNGLGYDWQVLQLGEPTEQPVASITTTGPRFEGQLPSIAADSVTIHLYTVPFWPLCKGRQFRIGVSVDGAQPQIFDHQPKEYSLQWKDEVLRNSAVTTFRFPIERAKSGHTLSLLLGDPGMMVQKVIVDWGGLQSSYLGPQTIEIQKSDR